MDVRHITSQPEYSREAVKDEQHKAFLLGFDEAINDLDVFLANEFEIEDENSLIEKMKVELATKIIASAKEWLIDTKLEHQVTFIDNEAVSETNE